MGICEIVQNLPWDVWRALWQCPKLLIRCSLEGPQVRKSRREDGSGRKKYVKGGEMRGAGCMLARCWSMCLPIWPDLTTTPYPTHCHLSFPLGKPCSSFPACMCVCAHVNNLVASSEQEQKRHSSKGPISPDTGQTVTKVSCWSDSFVCVMTANIKPVLFGYRVWEAVTGNTRSLGAKYWRHWHSARLLLEGS